MNIELNLDYIKSIAPNANAVSNGEDLYRKGLFRNFSKNAEGDLYFAECIGSGKNPYLTSMDCVSQPPVYRCSCPSRQFPCKHNLGLLFALMAEVECAVAEVPEALAQKRSKAEQRTEAKKAAKKATKTGAASSAKSLEALRKKIQTQLEALEGGQKLLADLVRIGLKQMDGKTIQQVTTQIEQFNAAYLTGIAVDFQLIVQTIQAENFPKAIELLARLSVLVEKAQNYLTQRLADPALLPDLSTEIEEQLGYAWKLEELIGHGKVQQHATMIEFVFYSKEDTAQAAYIDEGFWLETQTGKVYKTQTIRPLKAKKHLKEADSRLTPLEIPELVIYPGSVNQRVRWNEEKILAFESSHYAAFAQHAAQEFAPLLKEVKNEIKNPLGQKNPVVIVQVAGFGQQGENIVVLDGQGEKITLKNIAYFPKLDVTDKEVLHDSLWILHHLPAEMKQNVQLALMFEADLVRNQLVAKPLAIITPQQLVRLVF